MAGKKNTLTTDLNNKVLKVFKKKPKKHFSYKQVIKNLIQKHSKDEIVKAINDLVSQGKIVPTEHRKLRLSEKESRPTVKKSVEGVVDMTLSGSAYIISPHMDQDIYIRSKNLNRAFDGDRVKVGVYPHRSNQRPEGEVIEIIARSRHEFVGNLQITDEGYGFVVPDHEKMQVDLFVPAEKLKEVRSGDRVIARMTDWPDDAKNPVGEIVERLGAVGNNDTEMMTILIENGFPLKFPSAVMAEVEKISMDIPQEEIDKRKDFRNITTFTIDPDDAKDFDDALSLRKLENGNWEVGVHIADVSHYVSYKSALDKEAYKRATSVYLVDRVLPMLPEKLSNIVCSLRPEEEKLTFSAVFEMDEQANIRNRWFGRTVIRSDKRFTYDQVQEIIETGDGDFSEEVKILNDLALKLRKTKFQNGAIAFETVEVKFQIDLEGVPLGVYVKERKEANMLIEDFMLLANKEVAEFVNKMKVKKKQAPMVYRIHDSPDPEKLKEFASFAAKFGYRVQVDTPQQARSSLNRLMQEIKGKPEQDLLEKLAIRSMAKAVYTTHNIGHYGLAFDYYTHFTSPIRRYPDVLAHRVLQQILDKNIKEKKDELEEACTHSSWMERKAMDAERESIKYKQVEYIQNKLGQEFDGIISGVVPFGLFVEIIENKCEGLVEIDSLRNDSFIFDDKYNCLRGMATDITYQLGDKVRVKPVKTSLEKRQIDMVLIEDDE